MKIFKLLVSSFIIGVSAMLLGTNDCSCAKKDIVMIDVGPRSMPIIPDSPPKVGGEIDFIPVVRICYSDGCIKDTSMSFIDVMREFYKKQEEYSPITIDDDNFEDAKEEIEIYRELDNEMSLFQKYENYFSDEELGDEFYENYRIVIEKRQECFRKIRSLLKIKDL